MMSKVFALFYGVLSYLIFFVVFLYLIGFVGEFVVPKTVSSGEQSSFWFALFMNVLLIGLFALQHTVMARSSFKHWLTQFIPAHLERSTFMLVTSAILMLLYYYWQPMAGTLWSITNPLAVTILYTLFALGWVMILISTFLTNHFDLFGLRHIYLYFTGTEYSHIPFTKMWFYHWVRHPMMLGFIIAFWCSPVMTVSHFVFSAGMTLYILMGIQYEERGLIELLGNDYRHYMQHTAKLLPKLY